MAQTYPCLIDGELVTTDATLEVLNPANEQVVGQVPASGKDELDRAVAAARRAFKTWRKTSPEERQKVVQGIAAAIKDNGDELFRLLTTEQGKPHAQAQMAPGVGKERLPALGHGLAQAHRGENILQAPA